MSRYIDADKLTEAFVKAAKQVGNIGDQIAFRMMINEIPAADVVEVDKAQKEIDYWHDKAQSYEQTITKLTLCQADVVEVVRCKDCIYWRDTDHTCKHSFTSPRYANDFCSYGKKRDD